MPTTPITLSALSALDEDAFNALLGPVVEHSPWVAARAWALGPFASQRALFHALSGVIQHAEPERQLALLRAHPELAGREALDGSMTADSQSEQGRLGLLALDAATVQRITDLNQRYRGRFGFPFICALRLHATLASVLASFEERLEHSEATERGAALQQVCEVMRGRLARLVEPDAPATVLPYIAASTATPLPTAPTLQGTLS